MRGKDPSKDLDAKVPMNDETLFQNPYAALDQIAGKAPGSRARARPARPPSKQGSARRLPRSIPRALRGEVEADDEPQVGASDQARRAGRTRPRARRRRRKRPSASVQPVGAAAAESATARPQAGDRGRPTNAEEAAEVKEKAAAGRLQRRTRARTEIRRGKPKPAPMAPQRRGAARPTRVC